MWLFGEGDKGLSGASCVKLQQCPHPGLIGGFSRLLACVHGLRKPPLDRVAELYVQLNSADENSEDRGVGHVFAEWVSDHVCSERDEKRASPLTWQVREPLRCHVQMHHRQVSDSASPLSQCLGSPFLYGDRL